MRTNQQRIEVVSSNLANTETTGFKRMLHVAHGVEGWAEDVEHQQVITGTRLDMNQGVLQRTGEDLDLALEGPGFFVIDGPNEEMLTRQGEFQLSTDGQLVDGDSNPVQWVGPRGVLRIDGGAIQVDSGGGVIQDGLSVGRLRVVNVLGVDSVEPNDDGSYRVLPGAEVVDSDAIVTQGSLERANVQAVDELIELIAAQRAFDSAAQAFRTIDQSYQRLHQ